jgi:hypothetical protein
MPQPRLIARYYPISTSALARKRFLQDRARRYLARLDGRRGNDRIAQLIDQTSRSEWDLHLAEVGGAPLREVRECRKLVYFFSAAFERALKELPSPPPPGLAEYLAAKAGAAAA